MEAVKEQGTAVATVPEQPVDIVQRDAEGKYLWQEAERLAQSNMFSNAKTPEAAYAIVIAGKELGLRPAAALRSIAFFSGKIVIEAKAMVGAAHSQLGVTYDVIEWTDKVCRLQFNRPGWSPIESEFTIGEAKTAGLLSGDNWKKYPKDMLLARAQARGSRAIAPDLLTGSYDREELADIPLQGRPQNETPLEERVAQLKASDPPQQNDGPPILDAEIVEDDEDENAEQIGQLRALFRRCREASLLGDESDVDDKIQQLNEDVESGDAEKLELWAKDLQMRLDKHEAGE